MTKGGSLILRIYFGVVSAVTLFTLMYGTIDLLTIGLKQIVPGADAPEWGLEDCDNLGPRYGEKSEEELSDEELKAQCERRNADAEENYNRQQASNLVRDLATIIVSLPLFVIHFMVVYRDWKSDIKS